MLRTVVHSRVEGEEEDPYRAKLLKYIPAEVLAAFIPIMIAAEAAIADGKSGDNAVRWIGLFAGAIATVGYLLVAAANEPEDKRPLIHFYMLSLVAYAAWAFATSEPARDVAGIGAGLAEFIVAVVILLVPLADGALKPVVIWLRARLRPSGA